MKFFSWVQTKLNGGQDNRNQKGSSSATTHHPKKEPHKEEFSDWPNGFLAIGTFGNQDSKEKHEIQNMQQIQENEEEEENNEQCTSPDLEEFTPEEVGQLQKELKKLLTKKRNANKADQEQVQVASDNNLPLDRFLNCPSSLTVDRTISNRFSTYSDDNRDEEEEIDRTIRIILGRCKDVREKKQKSIGKSSLSFLVKKMFACRGGFVPTPSLRDTFQESRMEKLLRTMLSKKIYHQNSSRASSMKRYLEDKPNKRSNNGENEEETREKIHDGNKWVKTDSEYIVLEI